MLPDLECSCGKQSFISIGDQNVIRPMIKKPDEATRSRCALKALSFITTSRMGWIERPAMGRKQLFGISLVEGVPDDCFWPLAVLRQVEIHG